MYWMLLFLFISVTETAFPQTWSGMVLIPSGSLKPFFKGSDTLVQVSSFYLDQKQVSNQEFKAFTEQHPEWSASNRKAIFTDDDYLSHWANASTANLNAMAELPVVNVSWFAAKAYCKSIGKRLPTMNEWEYAAAAAPIDNILNKMTLDELITNWYSRRMGTRVPAGSIYQNTFGVWDMYGQVWEWVLDFDQIKRSDDSRNSSKMPEGLFCGSASSDATDASDYTSFIRFAFRSSLKGNYTVRNLGFRCAKDF